MDKNVIIYGAGIGGRLLYEQLNHEGIYFIKAFIDDNPDLSGSCIGDCIVYNSDHLVELLQDKSVTKVIVSIPSLSRSAKDAIMSRLRGIGAEAIFFPSHSEIIDGNFQINEASFLQLIGRDVSTQISQLSEFTGKNILVTGGGGSIGSEICKQLLLSKPKTLYVLDASELNLYNVSQSLGKEDSNETEIRFILGSYGDQGLLSSILDISPVNFVFHAGAYKHVSLVEQNVLSTVKNNIIETHKLFEILASHVNGKSAQIVNISTDKAVRPTNVMGATKRVVELIQRYFHLEHGLSTVNVRFGNVFGSSGSVIPLFVDQIRRGGPVTVTDPDVERFFMSIPEAVQLVLFSTFLSSDSSAYVLDMGKPVNIFALAKRLIHSFGFKPVMSSKNVVMNNEIAIVFTGLKKGEKLSEELSYSEYFSSTKHSKIMRCQNEDISILQIKNLYQNLLKAYKTGDQKGVLRELEKTIVSYAPDL